MYKLFIRKNTTSEEIIKNILINLGIEKYSISKNEYGCPYLKDVKDLYFNISNKDNYTVCGISNQKIGVDIEKITFKSKLLNRYFTEQEKDYILKSDKKDKEFTKIWVKKESYVKMLGIGLSYGLKNVDTFDLKNYFHIKKMKNYYICVCTIPST